MENNEKILKQTDFLKKDGNLNLSGLTSVEGLVLPQKVGSDLDLSDLSTEELEKLREYLKILPDPNNLEELESSIKSRKTR